MRETFAVPFNKNSVGNISPGQPLEATVRQQMESRLNTDFSGVRVHQGHEASLLNSPGFAVGGDIYMPPGGLEAIAYTDRADRLIGLLPQRHVEPHELTHTIQQREGVRERGSGASAEPPAIPAAMAPVIMEIVGGQGG